MKFIQLNRKRKTGNKYKEIFTVVDDEDYAYLNQFNWFLGPRGYVARTENYKRIFMHREIMGLKSKKFSRQKIVDHIDGNRRDNRHKNLRICSFKQNIRNSNLHRDSKTGYKGVNLITSVNRYRARIVVNGKTIHLGMFATAIEAAKAYDQAAKRYFGEFIRLNFPS